MSEEVKMRRVRGGWAVIGGGCLPAVYEDMDEATDELARRVVELKMGPRSEEASP